MKTKVASPDWIGIRFNQRRNYSSRRKICTEFDALDFDRRVEIPGEPLTLVGIRSLSSAGHRRLLSRLAAHSEIEYVTAARERAGVITTPIDRVIIGLAPGLAKGKALAGLRQDYDLRLIEHIGEATLLKRSAATPADVLYRLRIDKRIAFAEDDIANTSATSSSRPLLKAPSTTLGDQHALSEMNVHAAWGLQRGDPRVRIAVLDTGIAQNHPDLRSAYAGGYDALRGETEVVVDPLDGHGTACAGLAAGTGEISGSGRGCSLLGVRIASSGGVRAELSVVHRRVLLGLDWAITRGAADIISLSFFTEPSYPISKALTAALANGRGGLGTVVVAAAGNRPGPVKYPARLDGAIACSALGRDMRFKTPASSDVGARWGSASGPQIAVAAPGVDNLTTDIPGPKGLSEDDYAVFSGTSSSAPLVAGVCGLVLSANPRLTAAQVRETLVRTARPVGAEVFVDGRNDEVGGGIVDAAAAVALAKRGGP